MRAFREINLPHIFIEVTRGLGFEQFAISPLNEQRMQEQFDSFLLDQVKGQFMEKCDSLSLLFRKAFIGHY